MVVNLASKQEIINRNYNHIYAHEMAHKSAGGVFAGAISIERNADGIPVSGHVPIQMPVLNKKNPQQTIDHANTVIRAALAPSDPMSLLLFIVTFAYCICLVFFTQVYFLEC